MRNVRIRPVLSGVKELSGEFPTPEGSLAVAWKFDKDGKGSLKLKVPGEMKVIIDFSELEMITGRTITLNSKGIKLISGEKPEVEVRKGSYELLF